jgi:hypothetical protein
VQRAQGTEEAQPLGGSRAVQNAHKLIAEALRGRVWQERRRGPQQLVNCGGKSERERGHEPHRSEHTHRVCDEGGGKRGAQKAGAEVSQTTAWVNQWYFIGLLGCREQERHCIGLDGHGVDGEVSAAQVVFDWAGTLGHVDLQATSMAGGDDADRHLAAMPASVWSLAEEEEAAPQRSRDGTT